MNTAAAPSTRDRLAAWSRRWFRRLLGLTIAVVAAVWSFHTLTNLAQLLGFGRLSWMFPLTIDAVAALGMDYWMTRSPAWRLGRAMAMTAIIVSIAGNVADWLLSGSPWYTALFGVIPPAALAATLGIMHRNTAGLVELGEWLQAERDWRTEQAAEREAKRAQRSRKPVPTPPRAIEPQTVTKLSPAPERAQLPPASEHEQIQALVQFAEQNGRTPTKRDAMELLRVGSGKALKLTKTVRETVTTETTETAEEATG